MFIRKYRIFTIIFLILFILFSALIWEAKKSNYSNLIFQNGLCTVNVHYLNQSLEFKTK